MPHRVLVVDDEESFRTILKDHLEKEGFAVETADDGDVALSLLETERFDLMLLDIRMPRVDGFAVLRELRSRTARPRTIMLTAVDELSAALDAVRLGANDYLTKPFGSTELLACIRRVLAR
jgi:DNA-binding response OmpR family regulator